MISFSLNGSHSLALPQEPKKKTNLICHSQDQSVKGCWQSNLGVEWWKYFQQQQQPESQAQEEGSFPSGPLCSNLGRKRGLGIGRGGWLGGKKSYWRKGYEATNCCRVSQTNPTVVLKLAQMKTSSFSCSVSPAVSCIWDVTLFWVAMAPQQPLWNKWISLHQDPVTVLRPYWQPVLTASPPCAAPRVAHPQQLCAVTKDRKCTSTAAPEAGFCKVITEHRLGNLHHLVVPYFAQVCSQTSSQTKNQHFQLRKAEGQSAGRSCQRGWAVGRCLTGSARTLDRGFGEEAKRSHTDTEIQHTFKSPLDGRRGLETAATKKHRNWAEAIKVLSVSFSNTTVQLKHLPFEACSEKPAQAHSCGSWGHQKKQHNYILLLELLITEAHHISCFLLAHKYWHFKSPTNTLLL